MRAYSETKLNNVKALLKLTVGGHIGYFPQRELWQRDPHTLRWLKMSWDSATKRNREISLASSCKRVFSQVLDQWWSPGHRMTNSCGTLFLGCDTNRWLKQPVWKKAYSKCQTDRGYSDGGGVSGLTRIPLSSGNGMMFCGRTSRMRPAVSPTSVTYSSCWMFTSRLNPESAEHTSDLSFIRRKPDAR